MLWQKKGEAAMINKLIQKFIVWYLKNNNVMFCQGNFVVRMFTQEYYEKRFE